MAMRRRVTWSAHVEVCDRKTASRGGTTNDARAITTIETDHPSGVPMVNLEGVRSTFSAAGIDYLAPCSMADGHICHIFHHLPFWNEFLSQVCLELRHHGKTSMLLSLVDTSESFWVSPDEDLLYQGASLVHCLLRTHRCVAAVEVNCKVLTTYAAIVFEALRGNTSINALKITWEENMSERCLDILPSLRCVEELEFCTSFMQTAHLLHPLSLFVNTNALTILDISSFSVTHDATVLLPAIIKSNSLKELSLCGSVLNSALNPELEKFREHLISNIKLTSLYIVGRHTMRKAKFMLLLECLLENRTLTCVTIRQAWVDHESSQAVKAVIEHNDVLRCFNIQGLRRLHGCGHHVSFNSWLEALMTNRTLEEFTLPIEFWNEEQWRDFINSLAPKRSWNMTIEFPSQSYNLVRTVHNMAAESGVGQKIRFKCTMLYEFTPRNEYWQCYGLLISTNVATCLQILQHMPTLEYVTSAHLLISTAVVDINVTSAFTFFIRTSQALKKLHLHAFDLDPGDLIVKQFWSEIIESLSESTSLTEFTVRSADIEERSQKALACVLNTSRNIHTMQLRTRPLADYSAFVRALHAGVGENYVTLSVTLGGGVDGDVAKLWFLIRDKARLNSGLVSRAADFASGIRHDRYGAEALERVARHVALPERVSQRASVTETDAVVLIRDALRTFLGLHAFMRLAGVVNERVECHTREDGLPQLDNLGDSWTVVRQYLMLEDIKVSVVRRDSA